MVSIELDQIVWVSEHYLKDVWYERRFSELSDNGCIFCWIDSLTSKETTERSRWSVYRLTDPNINPIEIWFQ